MKTLSERIDERQAADNRAKEDAKRQTAAQEKLAAQHHQSLRQCIMGRNMYHKPAVDLKGNVILIVFSGRDELEIKVLGSDDFDVNGMTRNQDGMLDAVIGLLKGLN